MALLHQSRPTFLRAPHTQRLPPRLHVRQSTLSKPPFLDNLPQLESESQLGKYAQLQHLLTMIRQLLQGQSRGRPRLNEEPFQLSGEKQTNALQALQALWDSLHKLQGCLESALYLE